MPRLVAVGLAGRTSPLRACQGAFGAFECVSDGEVGVGAQVEGRLDPPPRRERDGVSRRSRAAVNSTVPPRWRGRRPAGNADSSQAEGRRALRRARASVLRGRSPAACLSVARRDGIPASAMRRVHAPRRQCTDPVREGGPWSLALGDRVLVAAY